MPIFRSITEPAGVNRRAGALYTDVVTSFTDQLAAEMLAKFIASAGFPCSVEYIQRSGGLPCHGVRVVRGQIPEIRHALKLTPVVNRLTPVAAQLKAGQLAREDIPCYIGGEHSFGSFGASSSRLDSITTLRETNESGDMIAVPASLFEKAMRILNQAPISDTELAQLALGGAQDQDDPP